jgi:hypothetical protein
LFLFFVFFFFSFIFFLFFCLLIVFYLTYFHSHVVGFPFSLQSQFRGRIGHLQRRWNPIVKFLHETRGLNVVRYHGVRAVKIEPIYVRFRVEVHALTWFELVISYWFTCRFWRLERIKNICNSNNKIHT